MSLPSKSTLLVIGGFIVLGSVYLLTNTVKTLKTKFQMDQPLSDNFTTKSFQEELTTETEQ